MTPLGTIKQDAKADIEMVGGSMDGQYQFRAYQGGKLVAHGDFQDVDGQLTIGDSLTDEEGKLVRETADRAVAKYRT